MDTVRARDVNRLPRENLETILEMTFVEPTEANVNQHEVECAICYT